MVNRDILYLTLKELQNDKKALFSCLTVNKTWCEIIIPILWRDPWKYLKEKKLLLNVIISHLSDESKNNLKSKGLDFLTNSYQRPLFNYISFCRHLNFNILNEMINTIYYIDEDYSNDIDKKSIYDMDKESIIRKEIFNLFINENTK